MRDTVKIRLKLLKMQGLGFSKRETVKHLSETFKISESAGYYHFATRDRWISQYFDFNDKEELKFNILNQFNQINREASFQYLHTSDHNAKIGFLRTRLAAVDKLAKYAGFSSDTQLAVPDLNAEINKIIAFSREEEVTKELLESLSKEEINKLCEAEEILQKAKGKSLNLDGLEADAAMAVAKNFIDHELREGHLVRVDAKDKPEPDKASV